MIYESPDVERAIPSDLPARGTKRKAPGPEAFEDALRLQIQNGDEGLGLRGLGFRV